MATELSVVKPDDGIDWKRISEQLRGALNDRVKSYNAGRAGSLSYIDARDVMDVLDDVVGPENWEDDYEIWNDQTCAVKATVTIHGRSKSDVGYPNTAVGTTNSGGKRIDSDEPYKDACTDAFKRACVHWGIGRFLYQDTRGKVPAPATETPPTAVLRTSQEQVAAIRDKYAEMAAVDPKEALTQAAKECKLPSDASRWAPSDYGKLFQWFEKRMPKLNEFSAQTDPEELTF